MSEPDYVICIVDELYPDKNTLCGRWTMGFKFTGISHAVLNARNASRLLICPPSAKKAIEFINRGTYEHKGEATNE